MESEDFTVVEPSSPYMYIDDALKEDFSRISVRLEISTQEGDKEASHIDTCHAQKESEFTSNLWAWNIDSGLRSVDNFASSYFDAIVDMKEDAVPFIYKELIKGPTPLVHALDYIYKGEVEYGGYLPLDFICEVWLEILKKKGISV